MTKLLILAACIVAAGTINGQEKPVVPSAPARGERRPAQTRPTFDLAEYGVQIQPEPRLIVIMAALDAAGFDPTPPGKAISTFRGQIRSDQAALDPDLKRRMREFFERRKLSPPANAAEQASRYISLAYAAGAPPTFDVPDDREGLPAGVLDVLDFVPLIREFYRKSGIAERMPDYLRAYRAEGVRLSTGDAGRSPLSEMVRAVLSHLHTRPILIAQERVAVSSASLDKKRKKGPIRAETIREHERRFLIVPDLLAVPGTINLRVIADDYYAIVPAGTNPAASELRRAYLQYVVDALVVRFSREIVARRPAIRQLIDERSKAGGKVSQDIFLTVSRSLVAAADAGLEESARLNAAAGTARLQLDRVTNPAERASIVKQRDQNRIAISEEATSQLADAYEDGAVLCFFFADQLLSLTESGFDIANFFSDMIAAFNPEREIRRPAEYAQARARAIAVRQARLSRAGTTNDSDDPTKTSGASLDGISGGSPLVKSLAEIEDLLRGKNYPEAESRLKNLLRDYPGEPRIFFALGQTASLAAADAVDEDVENERLTRAFSQYRMALQASTTDTDPALLSRSHEAMGRILAFQNKPAEALKEFDAAIRIGDVRGGAFQAAKEGLSKLTPK